MANAIIILDEAQTLPRSLLLPMTRALVELVLRYGCTVVLCTATQPALARREGIDLGLPLDIDRELALDPESLARQLARTRIRHQSVLDDAALEAMLGAREQILVIVNSRRHALDLYRQVKPADFEGLVHLTTRRYASDRRRILAEVRRRLMTACPAG
ncbi:hypothetical protein BJF92_15635 [Rhizobium rhizosphaerae]|uniref:Uncharacterized protein n=1 Tax=Xaviernesmea rhizosphaerae TaxID=1672749 RepID=A0A1Q9AM13_9HYPH|nr:hypothetical protein [Xaviernesmea rhizosphaerae]OLP56318.1 hypothetical protein BJF92_15635 [Xaviernesmea rhizosphaerae]